MTGKAAGVGEFARMTDFSQGAVALARGLLGSRLVRVDEAGRRCGGVIVETEAYVGPDDLAAHSAGGRRTARNRSMYLPGGHSYVYFVYGMHWCFNVVAAGTSGAEAVLIRAIEPIEGLELMAARRRTSDPRRLCAGPARLTQALAIDRGDDGLDLRTSRTILIERPLDGGGPAEPGLVDAGSPRPQMRHRRKAIATTRIGVEYAGAWAAKPWRFLLPGAEAWWSRGPAGPRRPSPR